MWGESLLSKAYAEFIGCAIFHFIGSVCPTPIANAAALTTMVLYTAKVSGGHLNPAVSLTFCLLGHTHPLDVLVYWVAQTCGCISGALWIAVLIPGPGVRSGLPDAPYDELVGCIEPHRDINRLQMIGWEAIATFCFIVPVMTVVWYTQHKNGYGSNGPVMVGVALYSVALATGEWTGALVNPARTVASDLVFSCRASQMIIYYIIGQVIGAVVAPVAIVQWYGIACAPWWHHGSGRVIACQPQPQAETAPESLDEYNEISLSDIVITRAVEPGLKVCS